MADVFWLNVIASNVGSFLFGFCVCRWLGRRAAAAADHLAHLEEPPMPEGHNARLPLAARVAVLVIVGLLMFGLGVRVGYQVLSDKVTCFDSYANDLADSLAPRQAAAEDLQDADVVVTGAIKAALTPGHDKRDVAALQDAIAAKARMQHRLDVERERHPYPDAPRKVCQ